MQAEDKETMSIIQQTINSAISGFKSEENSNIITDFHIQVNLTDGNITISDDDYNILAQTHVNDWTEGEENEEYYKEIARTLKHELNKMQKEKTFDELTIFKPFSFLLENCNREIINELLTIDEDNVMISDELLKGLDDELEDFLRKLFYDE